MRQSRTVCSVLLAACALLTSCGEEDWKHAATQFPEGSVDLGLFLRSLASRDYAAAHGWLAPELQKAWPATQFAAQVGSIRDEIGDRWKPKRVGFMNSRMPRGPVCSVSYRLEDAWPTKYLLDVVTLDAGQGPKIVTWMMSAPCDPADASLRKAQMAATEFLERLRKKEYDAALALVTAETRPQITQGLLAQISGLFLGDAGEEVAFTKVALRKLIAGVWYYSVVAFPKGKEMNHLEVILHAGETGVKVASLGFKAKVAGPGSTRPPK
ncbi:hypothetical protein HQ576_12935 [bacterium]|nr:hypothetical protein [bacterium]